MGPCECDLCAMRLEASLFPSIFWCLVEYFVGVLYVEWASRRGRRISIDQLDCRAHFLLYRDHE